jgi:prepilin-type N-terminal cleavage/methylation domain-containing protein
MPDKNEGYTLTEFLVTIAIIALLAILVLKTSTPLGPNKPRSTAQSEIVALSTALENYKAEHGDYPVAMNRIGPSESANANILYRALVLTNATGNHFFEPYKKISSTTNYGSASNYFVDPFGQPYQYRYPGDPKKSERNVFDLFSYGGSRKTADELGDQEIWIKNW